MKKIYSNQSNEEMTSTGNEEDFELPPICGYGTIKYLRRTGKLNDPTKSHKKQDELNKK